jgi:hypothetical protein
MNFHIPEPQSQVHAGKVGLVTRIASDESIVIGCARAFARWRSSSVYPLKIKARTRRSPRALWAGILICP